MILPGVIRPGDFVKIIVNGHLQNGMIFKVLETQKQWHGGVFCFCIGANHPTHIQAAEHDFCLEKIELTTALEKLVLGWDP
jgi:hypothetical protein